MMEIESPASISFVFNMNSMYISNAYSQSLKIQVKLWWFSSKHEVLEYVGFTTTEYWKLADINTSIYLI